MFITVFFQFLTDFCNLPLFGYFCAFPVFCFCAGTAASLMRGKRR